jgi:hypothetical protein
VSTPDFREYTKDYLIFIIVVIAGFLSFPGAQVKLVDTIIKTLRYNKKLQSIIQDHEEILFSFMANLKYSPHKFSGREIEYY